MTSSKLKFGGLSFQIRQHLRKPFTLAFIVSIVLLLSLFSVIYNHSINVSMTPLASPPIGLSKSHVMLLSYGRSGSSFTAALIAHHKDVFYTFEPLFVLARWPNNSVNERFYNTQEVRSREIIHSFLTCDFPFDTFSKLDNSFHRTVDSSRTLYDCLYSQKSGFDHFSCYKDYIDLCKSHKVTLVKTIRYRVQWAEWFMKKYPNFKLIILVRDPRATLFSQASVFRKFDWPNQVANFSRQHCGLVAEDIAAGELLLKRYPGRVLGIRYEDGALEPYKYAQKIYRFLGIDYDASVEDFIQNLLRDEEDKRLDAYSIRRKNFTRAMSRWRYQAGFNSVNKTGQICGHLFQKLGYKFVYSQKDLESDRLLVDTRSPGGIFYNID
uniref:Uncharacterized protein n=1 Tax=Biomphalaria glabrata TaxID=6526 RepID=A0A2C9KGF3_BIOGL